MAGALRPPAPALPRNWSGPGNPLRFIPSLAQLERCQEIRKSGGEKFTLTGDSVQLFSLPYQDVYIPDTSVVYCDPPYANTSGYLSDFDSAAFQDYVRHSPHLMVVSEYQMPEDFVAIAEFGHRSTLSGTSNAKRTVEKLFVHESKLAEYRERMEETKAKRKPTSSTAPTS